jgi:radical SAM superfamily enzyme YgiQ (UPF0313 family)
MGVFKVNLGLESFSDKTLKAMKSEKDSVSKNLDALRLLHREGIYVYGSLVLGTDSETPETLKETVKGAKQAISEGLISDIEVQAISPLPDNECGKKMKEFNLLPEDGDTDWPADIEELSKKYVETFSGVEYSDLTTARDEILEYARNMGINAGSGFSKAE